MWPANLCYLKMNILGVKSLTTFFTVNIKQPPPFFKHFFIIWMKIFESIHIYFLGNTIMLSPTYLLSCWYFPVFCDAANENINTNIETKMTTDYFFGASTVFGITLSLALIWVQGPGITKANPDAKRLYDDLLSNYNRLIRPVSNHTEKVTVKLGLRLSQLVDLASSHTVHTYYIHTK